jgi:hypothetical protein
MPDDPKISSSQRSLSQQDCCKIGDTRLEQRSYLAAISSIDPEIKLVGKIKIPICNL